MTTDSLTPEQARLVRENLGLVAVHLKRYVTNLATPRRDREWEDLFQEGCIGLIRAALLFREERGIPFAAFAFPRIHNAVSRALQTKFRNVYVPPPRKPRRKGASAMRDRTDPSNPPSEFSMGDNRLPVHSKSNRHHPDAAQGRHHPDAWQGRHKDDDTIGDRMRVKYERAVNRARSELSQRASTRGDRDALLDVLVCERFLIPQEEDRRPLRQIARDTKSSYARVAQCDKRMGELIRQFLEEDAEFETLRSSARNSPLGTGDAVDAALEQELAGACADQFTARLRNADPATRGAMLASLLNLSGEELDNLVRERFRTAGPEDRARMMEGSTRATQ